LYWFVFIAAVQHVSYTDSPVTFMSNFDTFILAAPNSSTLFERGDRGDFYSFALGLVNFGSTNYRYGS
jgi:hypothetical protein